MQVAGENGAWERDAPHSPVAPGWGLECPGAPTICEHAPFPWALRPFLMDVNLSDHFLSL